MSRLYIIIISLVTLLFISACSGTDPNSPEAIIENAVFADLNGNEVKVSDFEGKFLMIDFWETWCGPCLYVFPSLDRLREEYPDQFEVLAVTAGFQEGPDEARAFVAENDYDFNWLYDPNGVFSKLGGIGIPFKVFVDPDGNYISMEMGIKGGEGDYNAIKAMIEEYN